MLILIAGVSGNLDKYFTRSAFFRWYLVCGLGRSPEKFPPAILSKLEKFFVAKTYSAISAEEAMDSVDAIICAYVPLPELELDGQLIPLRACGEHRHQGELHVGIT